MSDLFILYTVVCYLFHLGFFANDKTKSYEFTAKVGLFISFVFSPIILPVLLGYMYVEKNE